MGVAVLIPFAGDCPHRLRARDWVIDQYCQHHPGWDVVVGEGDPDRWVKADAVAAALGQTEADVLVIADADVWCDDTAEAVEHCETWAIPHLMVHRLDQSATERLIISGRRDGKLDRRPYRGFAGGGITVVRRDVYKDCPLDPRFVGWGQEDASWAVALETLHGEPWRGASNLWHLWHPPQPRMTRAVGSETGRRLCQRYRNASRSRDLMRSVIEEV